MVDTNRVNWKIKVFLICSILYDKVVLPFHTVLLILALHNSILSIPDDHNKHFDNFSFVLLTFDGTLVCLSWTFSPKNFS